jgi:hypothetical protein
MVLGIARYPQILQLYFAQVRLSEAAHAVGLKPAACRAKAAAAAWMSRRRPASQRVARGFSRRAGGRTPTGVQIGQMGRPHRPDLPAAWSCRNPRLLASSSPKQPTPQRRLGARPSNPPTALFWKSAVGGAAPKPPEDSACRTQKPENSIQKPFSDERRDHTIRNDQKSFLPYG